MSGERADISAAGGGSASRRRGDLSAAGAVVLRAGEHGPEVVLVHRPRYDDWSLPKGKLRPDEFAPVAAVRETLEETGRTVRLGVPVGSATYEVKGRRKVVQYWTATQVGDPGRRIGDEVDAADWFPLDRALALLQHDNERAVTVAAAQAAPTVPLVIARHAKAFPRKQWRKADAERPLAKRGNDEALKLAGLLSAWEPASVRSSPSTRCLDTMRPYAAIAGRTVELDRALSEEGHDDDPAQLEHLIHETIAALALEARAAAATRGEGPGRGAVVCTHRPVLPTIADTVGIPLTPADREEALPPAGCWVLHIDADGSSTYERHEV